MSMSLGSKAEMNVTPMIDVLLVLIIIFMVITPPQSTGLETAIPQGTRAETPSVTVPHDIVISVLADGSVALNQEALPLTTLHDRLIALFKNGANQTVFVRGEKTLDFGQVATVIDIARGAGVTRMAFMTR